jgi:hypothetical protein
MLGKQYFYQAPAAGPNGPERARTVVNGDSAGKLSRARDGRAF